MPALSRYEQSATRPSFLPAMRSTPNRATPGPRVEQDRKSKSGKPSAAGFGPRGLPRIIPPRPTLRNCTSVAFHCQFLASFVGACASTDLQVAQTVLAISLQSTRATRRFVSVQFSQLHYPTLLVRGWFCCVRLGGISGILPFLESARNESYSPQIERFFRAAIL